jgi:hypothetical protein
MGSLRAYFALAAGLALVAFAAGQAANATGTSAWCDFRESWMPADQTRYTYANNLNGGYGSPVCKNQNVAVPEGTPLPVSRTGCQVRGEGGGGRAGDLAMAYGGCHRGRLPPSFQRAAAAAGRGGRGVGGLGHPPPAAPS